MAKLVAQHYSLQSVHAIVEAKLGVNVALALRMCPQGAQACRGRGVCGDDHAPLAGSAEVFAGIEAVAPERAESACCTPIPSCTDGLRGVFDQNQVMAPRKISELVHLRWLPIKVDRDDGARA